ncbi:hypothetical protein BC628DRAFT_1408371 [Trametes gibbosa]|nr:hypothetical protein BC628DRAFT_1408371 [Trametes gibbosa]UVI59128.1 Zn(2)-Cys(6)28 [Trametes gibbosa]
MSASNPSPDPSTAADQPSASGKAKQTRRRQRLSCVECTRRRQKCDRQIPCGLCVSRGVSHLCRWEPLAARPPPQRPPQGAPTIPTDPAQSTISALSARIASLEEIITRQNSQIKGLAGSAAGSSGVGTDTVESILSSAAYAAASSPSDASSSSQDVCTPGSGPEMSNTYLNNRGVGQVHDPSSSDDEECALSHYDYDIQCAAVALAQLSLAPEDEFIGSGTIPYALNKLGDPFRAKWKVARSANTTTVCEPFQPGNHPLSGPIQQLVASLPPRTAVDTLVEGYFTERNWEFGIPEGWFRQSCEHMWRHLALRCPGPACHVSGGCTRCTEELNPHWLALLFAVLALAPHRLASGSAKTYFLKAMEARRLVEDILLASRAYSQPGAVQGVVLSCIAVALLARYLADRGRVSDAWKLTGTALRNAQAVGLHRDPGWQKWDSMDKQERELRLLGWWSLVNADRFYSFILGRPMMAVEGSFDVKLHPGDMHGDGTPNLSAIFQEQYSGFCELIGEMLTKCMGIIFPAYATVLEMDRKFKFWLCRLHPTLDWRQPHPTSSPPTVEERTHAYQRHMMAGYYLAAVMNLHRPFLMHAPPILPPPKPLSATMTVIMNPSRERCIELAMELVRVMCDAQEEAAQWEPDRELPALLFHYCYFVFDGVVAVAGAFSQEPPHPKARECLALIDRAVRMLQWCSSATRDLPNRDGEGETASRAITIITALRRAGQWDERFRRDRTGRRKESGNAVASASGSGSGSGSSGRSSNSPQAPAAEPPVASQPGYAESLSMADAHLFTNGYSAAAAPTMATTATTTESNPIPFLTAPGPFSSFGFQGFGAQAQTASTLATIPMFGGGANSGASGDFGTLPAGGTTGLALDTSAVPGGTLGMQTMGMPFDMLHGGESFDVDWSAFAEIQGWPVNGLFDSAA